MLNSYTANLPQDDVCKFPGVYILQDGQGGFVWVRTKVPISHKPLAC